MGFCVFFALMGFASCDLVVHPAEPDAGQAGWIKICLRVAEEILS
jgi:hypothetical protein